MTAGVVHVVTLCSRTHPTRRCPEERKFTTNTHSGVSVRGPAGIEVTIVPGGGPKRAVVCHQMTVSVTQYGCSFTAVGSGIDLPSGNRIAFPDWAVPYTKLTLVALARPNVHQLSKTPPPHALVRKKSTERSPSRSIGNPLSVGMMLITTSPRSVNSSALVWFEKR